MLALSASEAELSPLVEQYAGCIDVAAVNGPQAVVVSGEEDAVLAVGRQFEAQGRRVSRLRVSHAFHSRRMEEMLEPFGRVVRELQLRPPTVPIILECDRRAGHCGRADGSGVLGAARAPDGAVLSSGSNAGASRHRAVFGAWSAGVFCRRWCRRACRKERKGVRDCGLRCARSAYEVSSILTRAWRLVRAWAAGGVGAHSSGLWTARRSAAADLSV